MGAGLNRFDPDTETFTRYAHDKANPQTIADDSIAALTIDRTGRLWVGTAHGEVDRIDLANGTIAHYRFEPCAGRLGRVRKILVDDAAETVWVAANDLLKLHPPSGQFTCYSPAAPAVNGSLNPAIAPLSSGEPPPGSLPPGGPPPGGPPPPSGPPSPGEPPPGGPPPGGPPPASARFSGVVLGGAGKLWLSGADGLYSFDPQTQTFTSFRPTSAALVGTERGTLAGIRFNALEIDQRGQLWAGTANAGVIYLFDPQTEAFIGRYAHSTTDPTSPTDGTIWSIYQSRDGVVWFGRSKGAVNSLDPSQAQFASYRNDQLSPDASVSNSPQGIYKDAAGLIWLGLRNGLVRFNPVDGSTKHYTPYDGPLPQAPPESLWIASIVPDGQGGLWFDGVDGLYRFDQRTETFERYLPAELADDLERGVPFWQVLAGHDRQLWLATGEGLYRFDLASRQFTASYGSQSGTPGGIGWSDFRTAYVDVNGKVWVGGHNAVAVLDPQTGQFTDYRRPPGAPPTIANYRVEAIHVDRRGVVWLGTVNGLLQLDEARGPRPVETAEHDLPTGQVWGILEDRQGHLWLSTEHGLARFDPQTGERQIYDLTDGLQGSDFNRASYFASEDGEMLFGGIGGLTTFFPEQIHENTYNPPVVLTDIRLFNDIVPIGKGSILDRAIWATDALTLRHDQKIVSFEFAALGYAAPSGCRTRHRGCDPGCLGRSGAA